MLGQLAEYFNNLLSRFARAINHLAEPTTQLPVMVHTRKTQILERQMPKLTNRLIDSDFIVFDFRQQFFYLFSINFFTSLTIRNWF